MLIGHLRRCLYVKTTQNSTGGTGTHSAGKLTKTEVSGKEDKLIVGEERGQAPFYFNSPKSLFYYWLLLHSIYLHPIKTRDFG
jgi:hypothetical protein